MKKALKALAVAAVLANAQGASATPSTTFWTPETTYVQPYAVPHITYDTYVAEKGILANTYGLTVGVLPFDKLQAEVGFDLFYPTLSFQTKDVAQVNAKVVLPENAFGAWQPGISVGIANAGFKTDVSNYDLVHLSIGKTLPLGSVAVGGYYGAGSKLLWTGSDGKVNRTGFMASWVSPDIDVKRVGLDKIQFLADVATGKNWMGAVGGGIGLFFNSAIDILTGPVYFFDKDLYAGVPGSGSTGLVGTNVLWTVQVDVDVDFALPAPPKK